MFSEKTKVFLFAFYNLVCIIYIIGVFKFVENKGSINDIQMSFDYIISKVQQNSEFFLKNLLTNPL